MILDDGGDATHVMVDVLVHLRIFIVYPGEKIPCNFQADAGHCWRIGHRGSQVPPITNNQWHGSWRSWLIHFSWDGPIQWIQWNLGKQYYILQSIYLWKKALLHSPIYPSTIHLLQTLPTEPEQQVVGSSNECQWLGDQDQVRQPLLLPRVHHWQPQAHHRHHVWWEAGLSIRFAKTVNYLVCQVLVAGYGQVGKGCCQSLKNLG